MTSAVVEIEFHPLCCVLEVKPLQSQNFLVFVESGILVEFFPWFRSDVSGALPARIHSCLGSERTSTREDNRGRHERA